MGQATWLTGDGLHLRAVHHSLIAAAIAKQSQGGVEAGISPGAPEK